MVGTICVTAAYSNVCTYSLFIFPVYLIMR